MNDRVLILVTWVRTRYERIALAVAALVLLWSASLITWKASRSNENASPFPVASSTHPATPPVQAIEAAQAIEQLRQPAQWTFNGRSGLFVPEQHFIGANGFPATLRTAEVHPPVPNEWLEKFGLPIADADVLIQDPDGDGFSNLEEWQSDTNPTDKSSHPSFIAKLKLKSFGQEPFRLVFSSWMDGTFGLNTNDLKEPTQFLRLGDVVRGTKFKLVKFVEKHEANKYGTKIDVSELTLENQENHEQLTLVNLGCECVVLCLKSQDDGFEIVRKCSSDCGPMGSAREFGVGCGNAGQQFRRT